MNNVFAHGSMANPISRVYQVFLENPQTPQSNAAKAAVATAGTQAFYDWHEVNLLTPNKDYRQRIPDGQLPGVGRAKYAGLNLARVDWPATKVQPGRYDCVFAAPTPHEPSYFEFYISKSTYDPTKPLKWSDLEPLTVLAPPVLDGSNYRFSVDMPQRVGRHVMYVIWQRIDPAGEAFFSTSDIDFGGFNYDPALAPNPAPVPKKASIEGGCGTGCTCPNPGTSPYPMPSPTPGATPVPVATPPSVPTPGAGNTRFENDSVIVTFRVTSDWISGFQGDVIIENKTSTVLKDWSLAFRFQREPIGPWNARVVSKSGDRYTFDAQPFVWNKDIPARGKVSFGFLGSPGNVNAAPTDFVFQASGAVGTPQPTPQPTPIATPTPPPVPTPTPTTGSPNTTADLGNVLVTFRVSSDWGSGFEALVTIENKTSAIIRNWSLAFNLDRGIANIWNARIATKTGNRYSFDAQPFAWNKDIPARGKVAFGFIGNPGGLKQPPTTFTFTPSSGSNPTPTPSPSATPTPTPTPTPVPTPNPSGPRFSIEDLTIEEPLTGSTTANVSITVSPTSTGVVGVMYQIKDGSAKNGSDFSATNGTVLFEPGTNRKTIPVAILSDSLTEGLETFTVELTTATGGEIARSIATVTIRDRSSTPSAFNYGEVLQKSLYFYDAQRSGKLPPNFRVKWRGDSALTDGNDVGIDLSGGYYDAGDHVKFGLPMTASMTLLAWGGIEYGSAYSGSKQKSAFLDAIRWGTDWIIKAHPTDNVFYGQVGNGGADHSYWGPPETMTMARPSYKVDNTQPGTEVAAEAAAALAAAHVLFKSEDAAYAQKLLFHARSLFAFADQFRGTYTRAIPAAAAYYNSYSGFNDELVWAAARIDSNEKTPEKEMREERKRYVASMKKTPCPGGLKNERKESNRVYGIDAGTLSAPWSRGAEPVTGRGVRGVRIRAQVCDESAAGSA